MMGSDCEICRGSGSVRLPIYRHAVAYAEAEPPELLESSRDYPCPECVASIPQERLAIVQYHSLADSRIDDDGYFEARRKQAAMELASLLLRGGFIRFQRGPNDDRLYTFPERATLGVVAPNHVATLEKRVAEHQEGLASEVITAAKANIAGWGSYSGDPTILKARAYDSLNEALKATLEKRASMTMSRKVTPQSPPSVIARHK